MAIKKFEKGSELWMMMNDLLRFFQETWEVEDNEEYWKELTDKGVHLGEVYGAVDKLFIQDIVLKYIDIQEEKLRRMKGIK